MEQIITVYDSHKLRIVGIVVVEEIEIGYIKDKFVAFGNKNIQGTIFALLSTFNKKCINTQDIVEKGNELAKNLTECENLHFLEPFPFYSLNKNKSSRHKRMLESMNLSHFERFEFNYDYKAKIC